ncbi:TIM barrel protein [uncultured Roseibium sp.]|uniref:hydroxypyruvate isomerase family protein n=1 Tax=uncultured Roseibium sp. TaxID=1936171 RepID=UPI003217866B
MARFSANLGFLWKELSLPDAIRQAKKAAFDAVECHWPYDAAPDEVYRALSETGLPMLSLNTRPGDPAKKDFGLCAVPGREAEAQEAIREAVSYARFIRASFIHVMAGQAEGKAANGCFLENLTYAADLAEKDGLQLLIEPINQRDIPGYFLRSTEQAAQIIQDLGLPSIRLMFDCYHVQMIEGDLSHRLETFLPLIGHVQIAAVPDRGEPDQGEVNYRHIVRLLDDLGYRGAIGAEYRPRGAIEDGLGWLSDLRSS